MAAPLEAFAPGGQAYEYRSEAMAVFGQDILHKNEAPR